jgi:hypothetical protein
MGGDYKDLGGVWAPAAFGVTALPILRTEPCFASPRSAWVSTGAGGVS